MVKKNRMLLSVCSVLMISIFFIYTSLPNQYHSPEEKIIQKQELETPPVEITADVDERQANVSDSVKEIPEQKSIYGDMSFEDNWCHYSDLTEEGNEKAAEEQTTWFNSRGYHYDASLNNAYSGYTVDTLIKLGEQGDKFALYSLMDINIYENPAVYSKTRFWAGRKAFIYGDSALVPSLIASNLMGEARSYLRKGLIEEAKKKLMESLAWSEVKLLRNDFMGLKTLNLKLERYFGDSIKFDDDDLKNISLRAQAIYDELEAERIALGLGKFDNTIPKTIQRSKEMQIASLKSKNITRNWINKKINIDSDCIQKNITFLKKTNEVKVAKSN